MTLTLVLPFPTHLALIVPGKSLRAPHCGRFEKELAAEALRKNENDTQKALDDLTNPEANTALQVSEITHEILLNFVLNFYHY
jgi:hypothetical protein